LGEFAVGNFKNVDVLAKVAEQIFILIKGVYKAAKDDSNDKENAFGEKYKITEVTEQLNKVLTALAGVDEKDKLVWPEPEEGKEPKKDDKDADPKAGGDDKADAPDKTAEAAEGGEAGKFCDVFLGQVLENPVLFDLIKSAVMSVELDSFDPLDFGKLGKTMVSFLPLLPDPKEWAGAAAILCIMVNKLEGEAADKEIFAKMKCSEDDMAELKEAAENKDKCALVFPGLSVWAADESAATAPKSEGTEVTFCLKNSQYYEKDGKFVICRYVGKIEEVKENTYTLSEYKEFVF
jgi:hypothetical protein